MIHVNRVLEELYKLERLYLNSFVVLPKKRIHNCSKAASILPEDCRSINLFEQTVKGLNIEALPGDEVIRANYFGPFKPTEYLSSNFRILVLLKEDYIMKDSYDALEDRGKHKKAEEFGSIEELCKNTTYKNLLDGIVGILDGVGVRKDDESDEDLFLNHTAVVNVNPFPGLAFNSTESDKHVVKAWANVEANRNMLLRWLDVIKPSLVIAGGTLDPFLSCKRLFVKVRDKQSDFNMGTIFDRKISSADVFVGYPDVGIYEDEYGTVWLHENHPSAWNYGENHISKLVEAVKVWMDKQYGSSYQEIFSHQAPLKSITQ